MSIIYYSDDIDEELARYYLTRYSTKEYKEIMDNYFAYLEADKVLLWMILFVINTTFWTKVLFLPPCSELPLEKNTKKIQPMQWLLRVQICTRQEAYQIFREVVSRYLVTHLMMDGRQDTYSRASSDTRRA